MSSEPGTLTLSLFAQRGGPRKPSSRGRGRPLLPRLPDTFDNLVIRGSRVQVVNGATPGPLGSGTTAGSLQRANIHHARVKCSTPIKPRETPVSSNAIGGDYTWPSHSHTHIYTSRLQLAHRLVPGYTWVCSPINSGVTELVEPLPVLNPLEKVAENSSLVPTGPKIKV